jgi:hypothetical protein
MGVAAIEVKDVFRPLSTAEARPTVVSCDDRTKQPGWACPAAVVGGAQPHRPLGSRAPRDRPGPGASRSRATARAAVIALSAALGSSASRTISRDTVGSEATWPNTPAEPAAPRCRRRRPHRARRRSRGQAPPCPNDGSRPAAATARAGSTAAGPARCVGPLMALAESAQMCSAKVLSGGRVEAASS